MRRSIFYSGMHSQIREREMISDTTPMTSSRDRGHSTDLEDRQQLTHVLEGQIQGFEPRYRGLGEVAAVHLTYHDPKVALSVS